MTGSASSAWVDALAERWGPRSLAEEAVVAAASRLRLVTSSGPADADLTRYQRDPIAWAVERLGIPEPTLRWSMHDAYDAPDWSASGWRPTRRWDGDADPLVRIAEALVRWESVAVESATGTGKTFFGALMVLWWLDVWRPATPNGPGGLVVTAAPKEKQLTLHIWKEIGALWPRFAVLNPGAELNQLSIRMRAPREDWGAVGFVAGVGASEQSSTKAQGFHAEHMLIILEETPGIHPAIMTAFENTCTAPHNLRLGFGNPDHELDQLHLMARSPGVTAIRISGYDHPNVVANDPSLIPGAVSRMRLDERRAKYGDEHRLTQSRSRGISPAEAADALIRMVWLRDAVLRAEDPARQKELRRIGRRAVGGDVANSETGDQGSICEGDGALCLGVQSFPCPDANEFARVRIDRLVGPTLPSRHIGLDSVGVGAGAVNEQKRLGHPVTALNGGAAPWPDPRHAEKFKNLRSQMYWTTARELAAGEIGIADADEELFADLTTPTYTTRNGVIVVESKESLKKRLPGQRSPDKGDAFVYWNWMRKDRRLTTAPRVPLSRSYVTT